MEEIGRIVDYGEEAGVVRVEIDAKGACHQCSSRSLCSPFGDNRRMVTEAISTKGARPGDVVRLEMEPKSTLGAAFLLYILPVIALVLGYALGVSFIGQEKYGIATSIGALAFSFVLLRLLNPMLAKGKRFKPVVVEIIQKGKSK